MSAYREWIIGEEVDAADLLDLQDYTRHLIGLVAAGVAGEQAFLPDYNALQWAWNGITFGLEIGSGDVYLPAIGAGAVGSRVAHFANAQTMLVTVNAAWTTNSRTDGINLQYAPVTVNPYTQNVLQPDGITVIATTVYEQVDQMNVQYQQGTHAGAPSPPSGWTRYADIFVPQGAVTGPSCTVDVEIPTLGSLIGTGVQSFTPYTSLGVSEGALTGAVGFQSSDGSLNVSVSSNKVLATVSKVAAQAFGLVECAVRVYGSPGMPSAFDLTTTGNIVIPGSLPASGVDVTVSSGDATIANNYKTGAGTWAGPQATFGNMYTGDNGNDGQGNVITNPWIGVVGRDAGGNLVAFVAKLTTVNTGTDTLTMTIQRMQGGSAGDTILAGASIIPVNAPQGDGWQLGDFIPSSVANPQAQPFGTVLGSISLSHLIPSPGPNPVQNTGGACAQSEWTVTVKSGAGPITVHVPTVGNVNNNNYAFLDQAMVDWKPSQTNLTIVIPDDGNPHNLVLQMINPINSFAGFFGGWLPNIGGTLNTAKIAAVSPGNNDYSA